MRLSRIVGGSSVVQVAVGDETLAVTYSAGAFTPTLEDQLDELSVGEPGGRPGRRFCELMANVLISWELEDDAGQPVPPSADVMMDLPNKFLTDTLNAISEDMRPGEAASSSGVGSRPAGSSEPNQTGTGSFPPPAGSESPRGSLQSVR